MNDCAILPPRHDALCESAGPCLLEAGHYGAHECETRDGRRTWDDDLECDCCVGEEADRCIVWARP